MLNAARVAGGDEVRLSVTEMLPEPRYAWVPDAQGRRYLSELRLQVRDPVPAGGEPHLTGAGVARTTGTSQTDAR
jgi:hypothetical protein